MRCSIIIAILFLSSCSIQKQLSKSAKENVFANKALATAHVGISIYEPSSGKYWYEYQGDKYFVPASNTKIPTCYAAMKYLGDSLIGLKYAYIKGNGDSILAIQPTGDPTLLHDDYKKHPAWEFLQRYARKPDLDLAWMDTIWKDDRWGSGWTWNDYDAAYMAERSVMPIYGNIVQIELRKPADRTIDTVNDRPIVQLFKTQHPYFDSIVNSTINMYSYMWNEKDETIKGIITRDIQNNKFILQNSSATFSKTELPFVTRGEWDIEASLGLVQQNFRFKLGALYHVRDSNYNFHCADCRIQRVFIHKWYNLYSQPTDSMLKPMMHRSDNFFAEQSLLMVSNKLLGEMNDSKIIDTLLKTDFKDLPQKPRWADGSGLSRYNLFTPQDMVAILNKMKNEFGMERIKVIFPTGGEGTISSYYKTEAGFIYAKTGTLSGVVALSGFLTTKKNKELIFSVLVNNHQASATDVRRAVEKFLQGIRNKY